MTAIMVSASPEVWRVAPKFVDEAVACSYDWTPRLSAGQSIATGDVTVTAVGGLVVDAHAVANKTSVLRLSAGTRKGAVDLLATLASGEKLGVRIWIECLDPGAIYAAPIR